MNRNIRFITRTAILLAIAIAFQFMGKFMGTYNNFIVGPIVNAVLIVATEMVGTVSGILISVIAPLVSALTNKSNMAPVILAFSPFIITGNAVLVLCYTFIKKKNKILALGTGAVAKFTFLYGSILLFVNYIKQLNDTVSKVLIGMFSWPQLLTAVVGGALALAVLVPLKKAIKD